MQVICSEFRLLKEEIFLAFRLLLLNHHQSVVAVEVEIFPRIHHCSLVCFVLTDDEREASSFFPFRLRRQCQGKRGAAHRLLMARHAPGSVLYETDGQ